MGKNTQFALLKMVKLKSYNNNTRETKNVSKHFLNIIVSVVVLLH